MLKLAVRHALKHKGWFFMKEGNELGNSSSSKSKGRGGTIVIVDDATQDISTLYGST